MTVEVNGLSHPLSPGEGQGEGITPAMTAEFERELAKYPADQRQSAVIACLSIVQRERGYIRLDTDEADAAIELDSLEPPHLVVDEVARIAKLDTRAALQAPS